MQVNSRNELILTQIVIFWCQNLTKLPLFPTFCVVLIFGTCWRTYMLSLVLKVCRVWPLSLILLCVCWSICSVACIFLQKAVYSSRIGDSGFLDEMKSFSFLFAICCFKASWFQIFGIQRERAIFSQTIQYSQSIFHRRNVWICVGRKVMSHPSVHQSGFINIWIRIWWQLLSPTQAWWRRAFEE